MHAHGCLLRLLALSLPFDPKGHEPKGRSTRFRLTAFHSLLPGWGAAFQVYTEDSRVRCPKINDEHCLSEDTQQAQVESIPLGLRDCAHIPLRQPEGSMCAQVRNRKGWRECDAVEVNVYKGAVDKVSTLDDEQDDEDELELGAHNLSGYDPWRRRGWRKLF